MTIEQLMVEHVQNQTGVRTGGEIISGQKVPFIVVQKRGGSRRNMISSATMQFDCYAESLLKASELCKSVQKAVEESTALNDISGVEFGGDYNSTDPDTKRHCYTAMYDITHYL